MLKKHIAALISVISLIPGIAAAQTTKKPELPDSPTGKCAAALLKVFEQGDDASIKKFLDEHAAPELRDGDPAEVIEQLKRSINHNYRKTRVNT